MPTCLNNQLATPSEYKKYKKQQQVLTRQYNILNIILNKF